MRPQHDNFLIRKDLDQEFFPTPPVTTFAYFSLFLPQYVTVFSLYNPHSANLKKRERERRVREEEREGGGEREGERRENRKEMGRAGERKREGEKGEWEGDGREGRERERGERERGERGGEGRRKIEDLKMFLTEV